MMFDLYICIYTLDVWFDVDVCFIGVIIVTILTIFKLNEVIN